MRNSLRKRNNIMIGALCAVLLLMVAGYAAFSTRLDISSGASINSKWDIEITNIRSGNPWGGDAYDITPPTYTKTSANFSTGLKTPNTDRFYEVEISNLGNLAGYVTIANLSCGDNSAIQCMVDVFDVKIFDDQWQYSEITTEPNWLTFENGQNDYSSVGFSINPGQKHYLYIAVGYKDVTSQPENLNANIQLDLIYAQDESVAPEPTPIGQTVYRYGSNFLSPGDGIEGITTATDYTELGKNFFLKHNVTNSLIDSSEVCFIKNELHCLKGGDSGTAYETNKALLLSVFGEGACTVDSDNVYCGDGSLYAYAYADGHVKVSVDREECFVNADGTRCGLQK